VLGRQACGGRYILPVVDRSISSFFLSSPSAAPALRVGLLLDGWRVNRAVASVIRDIQASDFARLQLVLIDRAAVDGRPLLDWIRDARRRRRIAFELYERLDEWRVRAANDPTTLVDASALLAGIAASEVRLGRGPDSVEDVVERTKAETLDVILDLRPDATIAALAGSARHGVWRLRYGDGERYSGRPAYFWEVVDESPISSVVLEQLSGHAPGPRVLARAAFATDTGSVVRNRAQPYFGSTHMVIQKLRQLHAGALPAQGDENDSMEGRPRRVADRQPTNGAVMRWLLAKTARKLRSRLRRMVSPNEVEHWQVAIRAGHRGLKPGSPPDMSGFRWIDAPKGHAYADPFLVERAGRTWLFMEDLQYAQRRAVISCAEVGPDGRVGPASEVLSSAGHLSYPQVFEVDGTSYMLPESSDGGAIRLYRATEFPHRWEMESELFRVSAVDTTVWQDGARWWFFTTLREARAGGMALMLFHADSLTGPWVAHPQNPLSVDVRNARSAGAIFHDGERLWRPSQDCSRGYGYSFTLNEIVTLSPTAYEERPGLTVTPDWDPGLLGTHTYNRSGRIEVTDGKVGRSTAEIG